MGRTKYVSVDIRFEFLQWALWRTLIKTKYFLLVHHTTSHLANLNTWWFKHSGDISCFLLVKPRPYWWILGRAKHVSVDICSEFIHYPLWKKVLRTQYFLFVHNTTSTLAKLSTWWFEHSGGIICFPLVNLSHAHESWEGRNMCLWIYVWICSLSSLANIDENRRFFVRSPLHNHFGLAQHMVLWALWWH